jgi:hypothetical protein
MDQGQAAAFTGALDRPPSSTWEIINPREYEKGHVPVVPLLPDIHPLVDQIYRPYDIGQVGQLDVHILAGIFGGETAANDFTPAWDGGLYWAGQLRNASAADQASTKSIALLYFSAWKSSASAQAFAKLYAAELGRKYSGLKPADAAQHSSNDGTEEKVFTTDEGPVVITTRGKFVFVTESFNLDLARRLTALVLAAQGSGEMKLAAVPRSTAVPSLRRVSTQFAPSNPGSARSPAQAYLEPTEPLTGGLVRFLSDCGVMKVAVDAAIKSVK